MQAIFWNLSSHAFSLFSLGWVGADGKILCYLILNMHMRLGLAKKKYSSHITEKTVGFTEKEMK